jgi:hypothetical protein
MTRAERIEAVMCSLVREAYRQGGADAQKGGKPVWARERDLCERVGELLAGPDPAPAGWVDVEVAGAVTPSGVWIAECDPRWEDVDLLSAQGATIRARLPLPAEPVVVVVEGEVIGE